MRVAELIWTSVALPKHRFIVWLEVQGRLLTRERNKRLNIPADNANADCCLCEANEIETKIHLFVECSWIWEVWHKVNQWTGVAVQHKDVQQVLINIQRKHWKKFMKEAVATLHGAIIYHTWRARNWKRYKGKAVNIDEVITMIKKELLERINLHRNSKKAQRCRNWIQHLVS
ncbi:hypothetical protein P3L10_023794 [Capsicum annuum]